MRAELAPFTHHLVGAVHVLTLYVDEPELTRRVLEQERSVCAARRIIVDLSRVGARIEEHLEVMSGLAWNRDLMVRLAAGGTPAFLEELDSAIVSAG